MNELLFGIHYSLLRGDDYNEILKEMTPDKRPINIGSGEDQEHLMYSENYKPMGVIVTS